MNPTSIEKALERGRDIHVALRSAAEKARSHSRTVEYSRNDTSDMFGIQMLTIWWLTNQSSAQDETLRGMPAALSPNAKPEIPTFDMGAVLRGMSGLDAGLRGFDADVGKIDLGSNIDRSLSSVASVIEDSSIDRSYSDNSSSNDSNWTSGGSDYSSSPGWD